MRRAHGRGTYVSGSVRFLHLAETPCHDVCVHCAHAALTLLGRPPTAPDCDRLNKTRTTAEGKAWPFRHGSRPRGRASGVCRCSAQQRAQCPRGNPVMLPCCPCCPSAAASSTSWPPPRQPSRPPPRRRRRCPLRLPQIHQAHQAAAARWAPRCGRVAWRLSGPLYTLEAPFRALV